MTTSPPLDHDDLERGLTALTQYQGDDSELWKQALDSGSPAAAGQGWLKRLLARPLPHPALAACLVVVVGVMMVAILMPSLGKARQSARQLKDSTQLRGLQQSLAASAANDSGEESFGRRRARRSAAEPEAKPDTVRVQGYEGVKSSLETGDFAAFENAFTPADPANNQVNVNSFGAAHISLSDEPSDRFVIRKATIDLETPDVRAAFAKAAHLASEAQSEYVENSSLVGTGKDTAGTLTLRVSATRLGAVLTSLRELGTVKAENTTGEDVTTQAVDLEARIRNDQKVEQELLQLLEKRADAPLKEILELRASISQVRESIERLIGQRDRLSRLVSLASILITIRAPQEEAKPAPAPEKEKLSAYFTKSISTSWRSGLEFLADTLAGAISLIIGGLIWWLLLATAVMAILRYRQRAIMRGA